MKYTTAADDLRNGLIITATILAATLIAMFFMFQLLIHGYSPWQVLTASWAPSDHQLQRMGEPIVAALERHHAKNGVYPTCLPEAGIYPPMTFFGPWRYETTDDQASCRLCVAEYQRYNFALGWTSGMSGYRGWYSDH